MKDVIQASIEQMEAAVVALEESASGPENVSNVLSMLGLSHLKLPSAQLITLFDMLKDGIQPVTPELVTSLLGICEAHKRLLYALGGFVSKRAEEIEAKAAALAAAGPAVAVVHECVGEDPCDDFAEDADADIGEAAAASVAAEQDDAAPAQAQTAEAPGKAQDGTNGNAPARGKREGIFSVRVNTEKLDNLIDWVGKLMVSYAVISQNKNLDSATISGLREMDLVIDRIKSEVDHIRLVPLKQIFIPLHRLVTSTAQKVNKKIEMVVEGDDLELDKMIVENLNEPLVHMLRNAVDHGVEPPEERTGIGKPATGVIRLHAYRKGDHAYISIRDDGRGLNPERIRNKAREKGLLEEGRTYTNEDLYQFIMASGFSTAETVTDISGRGVGMDAVLNAVKEQLNGEVRVDSELGKGTTFLISIPLARSVNEGIVDALITRVGTETFIIPSRDVLEVFAAKKSDTVELPDGSRAVSVRGETFPIIPLADYFGLTARPNADGYLHTIVVKVGDASAALLIDEVITQQQAVVTGFTIPLQSIYQIPILGFGMLGETDALVVDVENLIDRLKASDGGLSSKVRRVS
jgi:two-component system chemotaxis sensor kinase CheA